MYNRASIRGQIVPFTCTVRRFGVGMNCFARQCSQLAEGQVAYLYPPTVQNESTHGTEPHGHYYVRDTCLESTGRSRSVTVGEHYRNAVPVA